jgi:hypothetical protein
MIDNKIKFMTYNIVSYNIKFITMQHNCPTLRASSLLSSCEPIFFTLLEAMKQQCLYLEVMKQQHSESKETWRTVEVIK